MREAWSQPGAAESHANLSSEAWISLYVKPCAYERLLPTTYPYIRASLSRLTLRISTDDDPGRKFDLDEQSYTKERERQRIIARNQLRLWAAKARAREQVADRGSGTHAFLVDGNSHRSVSQANTLKIMYLYPAPQTSALRLNSPRQATPAREIESSLVA